MKKFLTSNLAAAVLLGMSATSFAASPFSDVPETHWARQALEKLAAEGVVEGYEDRTYRGDRNITRYEMAQMVARALARYENAPIADKTTPAASSEPPVISAGSRADLDRLAAEFRDELDSLNVRVTELEKHDDPVQWSGKIETTFDNLRTDKYNVGHKDKEIDRSYTFYLVPEVALNKNWTAVAEFHVEGDWTEDSTGNARLNNMWAAGDFGNFALGFGRLPFYTNEEGLVFDTDFSGAILLFGNEFYVALGGGRIYEDTFGGGIYGESDSEDFNTDILGVNVQYDPDSARGLYGGAGFYYIKDKDFMTENYSNSGTTDKAQVWSVNASYGFTDKLTLFGSFAQNTKADHEKSSWQAELEYGNYDGDYGTEKGDWSVFAGYRKLGTNVSFVPSDDDVMRGMRGWFVGANYAPFKNIGLTARYFKGKYITGKGDAQKIFGEVDFFF